jgi:hypothetical protein
MGSVTSIVPMIRQRAPGPAPEKSEVVQFPIDVFTEIHEQDGQVTCMTSKSTCRDLIDFVKWTCAGRESAEFAPDMNLATLQYHSRAGTVIAITASRDVIRCLAER